MFRKRSSQFVTAANQDQLSSAPQTPKRKHYLRKKLSITIFSVVTGLVIISIGGWLLFLRQSSAVVNPFNATVLASVKFPLYYPTQLPSGFHINPKSVTEPQANVIVFTMDGPKNEKLYMSEEARPSTFNLGGFYNTFTNLKEVSVNGGAIAVGHTNGGQTEIGSRANNQTWIITNTATSIPFSELITMLKSITVSY